MKIILASQNKHKAEEIKPVLSAGVDIISLHSLNFTEDIPETGDTLEANALQKAMFIYGKFHIPCLSDDTGLEVEALNGMPGVYSARYAGEKKSADDNIRKLLDALKGEPNRKARFKTVVAFVEKGNPVFFTGIITGRITEEKRGQSGFGYDPVFMPDGYSITLAEMSLEEKNRISHRAIAVKKFAEYMVATFS